MKWYCILLTFAFIFCCASSSIADIKLETQLSSSTLFVGDEITLQLKVDGAEQSVDIQFPQIDGLRFRQIGGPSSSSQTIIINGKVTRFSGLIYTIGISASKEGSYTVPGLVVRYDGQAHQSEPFSIRAKKPGQLSSMKLKLDVSRDRVYVRQPVTVSLKWYIQEDVKDYEFRFPLLEQQDELALQLVEQKGSGAVTKLSVGGYNVPFVKRQQSLEGKDYTMYRADFRIIPPNPGTLDIEPASVKAMIVTGTEMKRNFFNQLVKSPKLQRIFAASEGRKITVSALPLKNQPDTFTGAVGSFDISLSANLTRAKVGDPIEVTITIFGDGRLENIEKPLISKIPEYQKKFVVTENLQPGDIGNGRIEFKQTIRPRHEDVDTIPPIPFSYFDPESAQYKTIESNSVPLEVLAARKVSEEDIYVGSAGKLEADSELKRKEKGIYSNYVFEDALERQGQNWFWLGFLALPPFAYLGIFVLVNRQRKLREDVSGVRSRSAGKTARKRLKQAEKLIRGDNDAFFLELSQVVKGYIADRLNLGSGELTTLDIRKIGNENGLPDEIVDSLASQLDQMERYRFLRMEVTEEQKRTLYNHFEKRMKDLEKNL